MMQRAPVLVGSSRKGLLNAAAFGALPDARNRDGASTAAAAIAAANARRHAWFGLPCRLGQRRTYRDVLRRTAFATKRQVATSSGSRAARP